MLHPDPRGYRVALITDAVVNGGATEFDAVALLQANHFGMIVLPPDDFEVPTIAGIVEYVVDDLAEYASQGYRVVIVEASDRPGRGVWSPVLDPELGRRDGLELDRIDVVGLDAEAFLEFLVPAATTAR